MELFEHHNLPILVVDKLQDFLKLEEKDKLEKYFFITKDYRHEIYIDWWFDYIKSKN